MVAKCPACLGQDILSASVCLLGYYGCQVSCLPWARYFKRICMSVRILWLPSVLPWVEDIKPKGLHVPFKVEWMNSLFSIFMTPLSLASLIIYSKYVRISSHVLYLSGISWPIKNIILRHFFVLIFKIISSFLNTPSAYDNNYTNNVIKSIIFKIVY